jgi:2-dehydro-3-deoxygluconokinase
MTTYDVTTLGESMLRLSVPAGRRLATADSLDVFVAGAESNVVSLLARLGRRTAWCGALPDNDLGRLSAERIRAAGVDMAGVAWRPGERMGAYFVEFAAPPRATHVIYDRADSAAARLEATNVNWEVLLDTRLLHLTGITPALSPQALALTTEIVWRARAAGRALSFDVNFRGKLWASAQAAQTLSPLMEGAELVFCSRRDAEGVFGLHGEPETQVRALAARSGARVTVMSLGDQGALALASGQLHHAPAVPVMVLDRLGAGDALAAGVLHGWLAGDVARGLRYGTALAGLALSQYGDMVITTAAELEALLTQQNTLITR